MNRFGIGQPVRPARGGCPLYYRPRPLRWRYRPARNGARPGLLSPHAHARIKDTDVSRARGSLSGSRQSSRPRAASRRRILLWRVRWRAPQARADQDHRQIAQNPTRRGEAARSFSSTHVGSAARDREQAVWLAVHRRPVGPLAQGEEPGSAGGAAGGGRGLGALLW